MRLVVTRYIENIFIDGFPGRGSVHANATKADLTIETGRLCLKVEPVGRFGVKVELTQPTTQDVPLASWIINDAHRDEPIQSRIIELNPNDYPCGK